MYDNTTELNMPSFEEVFEEARQGKDVLLVLSGGMDSAYILWKYSQIVKDRPIYTHHIHLYPSWSPRLEVEDFAIKQQIAYLGREVSVTRSLVDTEAHSALIRDLTLGCLLSAEVAVFHGCSYIMAGDDLPSSFRRSLPFSEMAPHKKRMNISMGEYVRAVTNDTVDVTMGMESNLVAEAYNEMPTDYMELISSCREPVIKAGHVNQCGSCASCEKNKRFGFFDKISKRLVLPDVNSPRAQGLSNV